MIKMSYSQYKEDLTISNYFKNRTCTFLDLGANDGITISNTYLMYNLGWNGVLVEGSPIVFERLKENFKNTDRIQCLNYCLSDKPGKYKFYHNIHHSNNQISNNNTDLLSTIDEESYKRAMGWGSFDFFEIECYDFKKIEENSIYNKYELISIDIEGLDYQILSQIDLAKYKTEMLVIEYNNDSEKKQQIISYCYDFGLNQILLDNEINIILAK